MYNAQQYKWTNITGATATTNIFTGSGTLGSVIINAANGGGTITITDVGSPTATLATITISGSAVVALPYHASISGGLRILTSTSPNLTVTWIQG